MTSPRQEIGRIYGRSAAPADGVVRDVYINTVSEKMFMWKGGLWVPLATAAGDLSDYVAPKDFTPAITPSAGTWTAPTYTTMRLMKIGKKLTLWMVFQGTTSAGCTLVLTIPDGYTAPHLDVWQGRVLDAGAGTWTVNTAFNSSSTQITIGKDVNIANFGVGVVIVQMTLGVEVA